MENSLCEFCNKTFSSKYTLLTHQKTSKTCLKIQQKSNETYKCIFCLKILSTQSRLNCHIKICKVKLQKEKEEKEEKKNEIDKYKEIIAKNQKEYKKLLAKKEKECNELIIKKEQEYNELLIKKEQEMFIIKGQNIELTKQLLYANNTIADIAKQPKTINTNNSNNDNRIGSQNNITQRFDINDVDKITKVLENHLTPDVLAKGQRGVAEMLKIYLLQNENGKLIYECTDVSRQKFEFVNTDGNVETDPRATKLLRSLNNANIFDVTHSTGKKLWEKEDGTVNHDAQSFHILKVGEVLDINNDSSKFRSHLATITSK